MGSYQSENIIELAKVLLDVQRIIQPAIKDAENPFTKSWYASLNSVMDARRDATHRKWHLVVPVPCASGSSPTP